VSTKLPNDVIFCKSRHIVIVTSNGHSLNNPTIMVRFIQATCIVYFYLEDFGVITNLNKQLSNFEFVKRPFESSLRVFSML